MSHLMDYLEIYCLRAEFKSNFLKRIVSKRNSLMILKFHRSKQEHNKFSLITDLIFKIFNSFINIRLDSIKKDTFQANNLI